MGDGNEKTTKISLTLPGTAWTAGWLFTIGYLHLSVWQSVLAIVLWPYDIGAHWAPPVG